MAFPAFPQASRNQIRAAGAILASDSEYIAANEHARTLLYAFRACHLLPLDAFADDLQKRIDALSIDGMIALRLKRLFRIVEKLRQQTSMNVTTMQDIAGLRAIAPNIADVYRILDDFKTRPPQICHRQQVTDYIASPKDSGYRCVHLSFRYKGSRPSGYDGLRVELQIRSELQHLWASAVEISGLWTGRQIKYDDGDPAWTEFFSLVAEVIARNEGTARAADYVDMADGELRLRLAAVENDIDALKVMRAHASKVEVIESPQEEGSDQLRRSLLLQLELSANRLTIESFSADDQAEAMLAYAEAEQHVNFADGSLAPVLVSVNSTSRLRDAYRTFFMEITPFADFVEEFVRNATPMC
jgi:hypothetical protein